MPLFSLSSLSSNRVEIDPYLKLLAVLYFNFLNYIVTRASYLVILGFGYTPLAGLVPQANGYCYSYR